MHSVFPDMVATVVFFSLNLREREIGEAHNRGRMSIFVLHGNFGISTSQGAITFKKFGKHSGTGMVTLFSINYMSFWSMQISLKFYPLIRIFLSLAGVYIFFRIKCICVTSSGVMA